MTRAATFALILLLAAGHAGAQARPTKHRAPLHEQHVAPAPPPPATAPLTPPVPGPTTGMLPDATKRVDEGFRDLFPVHPRMVAAAVDPPDVMSIAPIKLMMIACPLAAFLAWHFARWLLPDDLR